MVLYIDNEFYVIQILESFYVEIIIFPVIFDGQTPMWSLALTFYLQAADLVLIDIPYYSILRIYLLSKDFDNQ